MADLQLTIFLGILVIQFGSVFLGWLGLFAPATASLLISWIGAVGMALLVPGDSMRGMTIATIVLPLAVALTIAVLWHRKRVRPASQAEPDHYAIGQKRLEQMNANIAERRTKRNRTTAT